MRNINRGMINRIQHLELETKMYKFDDEVIIVDVDNDGTTHFGDMTFKDYKSFERWLNQHPSLQPPAIIIDNLSLRKQ